MTPVSTKQDSASASNTADIKSKLNFFRRITTHTSQYTALGEVNFRRDFQSLTPKSGLKPKSRPIFFS